MENKFRNEMEIELAGTKILLRPTFENVAAMETNMGGLAYLTWKMASNGNSPKALPSLSECAKIIFFNQSEQKEDGTKKYSLEQIWEMIQEDGIVICKPVIQYLGRITAGNKNAQEFSDFKKKD
jgi:hypothetical protein